MTQTEPSQEDHGTNDNSNPLRPPEARRPTQAQGICIECDEDKERAYADHDPGEHWRSMWLPPLALLDHVIRSLGTEHERRAEEHRTGDQQHQIVGIVSWIGAYTSMWVKPASVSQ